MNYWENVYTNALAVKLGGSREYAVVDEHGNNGRIDLFVDGGVVIEAKYRPRLSDVDTAITQLLNRAELFPSAELIFFAVLSSRREARAAEMKAIESRRSRVERHGISVMIETERTLDSHHSICGVRFQTQAELVRHCQSIARDYAFGAYLCDEHQQFLLELADGYCRRVYGRPVVRVTATQGASSAMILTVHSGQSRRVVPTTDLARGWIEWADYQRIYSPALAGVCHTA